MLSTPLTRKRRKNEAKRNKGKKKSRQNEMPTCLNPFQSAHVINTSHSKKKKE